MLTKTSNLTLKQTGVETPPLLDEAAAAHLASLFSALSDPSRVRIIATLLAGPRNVSDIAQAIGLSESAVSHQLRGLRQMRLVRAQKQGREVYYTLDDEHVVDLFQRGLDHVRHG
jgi:ArsR family transcriptional regulator, lead/cadmium/zinc/bismuth-responsive transcriptional repressor